MIVRVVMQRNTRRIEKVCERPPGSHSHALPLTSLTKSAHVTWSRDARLNQSASRA